ncbi:MAG: elongation factor P [Candidatus Marinimicrobia bacterium]|nr:elongation factor P [Candidatus Neomarinimicrobiota bacterium]
MATTSDFKNGSILQWKDGLWKIVDFQHVKPGKGPAFVRTKLKSVKTGQVVDETFRAGEKIEFVRLEARDYNYMYNDGEFYYFMDNGTYEQIRLNKNQIDDVLDYLIENTPTIIAFNGTEPIEVRIPQHMNLTVIETDPGEKGNTATGGTKPATLETGVVVQVPLFVHQGETIRVDTKIGKYIERVKS